MELDFTNESRQRALRRSVSGLMKSIILARDLAEPGYLSNKRQQAWHFATTPHHRRATVGSELARTKKLLRDFDEAFIGFSHVIHDPPDPADEACHELVNMVAIFFERFEGVYRDFQAGKRIAWTRAFKWSLLPKMRRILDTLPLKPAPVAPKFTANECRLMRIYELALQFPTAKGGFRRAAIRDEWNRENPEDSLGEKKDGSNKVWSVIRAARGLLKKHNLTLPAALTHCPAKK